MWAGKGKPTLGAGLKAAKLGTIKRPNGKLQVTYNKFPLYRYYLDKKPGQANGEGVDDCARHLVRGLDRRARSSRPRRDRARTIGTTTDDNDAPPPAGRRPRRVATRTA